MPSKKAENEKHLMDVQFKNWWDAAEQGRSDYDWRWFLYDLWVTGNHYAKWDKQTQQITTSAPQVGHVQITINKVYTTLRSVRNFVLRNRPRAEVNPEYLTPENVEEAIKLNRYLDFLHDKLKMRRKLKASLWHSLKQSVGFWQILWDADEKEIVINVVDPYDLYIDPVARDMDEARYLYLAVRRTIDDVTNDPKYRDYIKKNKIELKGDGKLAASSYKERLMNYDKTEDTKGNPDKNSTVIVKELWYKEYDEEGKQTIKITTRAGDVTIREPEDTKLDRFPFFKLPCDVDPLKMYGQGWVKNLISPNKLLNRLESSVAEWNDLMNKGKWVTDKGAGVRVINNSNGQIIEKKRGFDVTQAAIQPMSAAVFKQIDNVNTYIEDIGGAHDASMGRIPTGAKSGKALEALQVGDSNNMSEIVENVEEFLEDVYEYILKLAAEKYQFARNIITFTNSGERDFITLIGEDAKDIAPEGAVIIPKNVMVDVKITSWLAETQEARRDALLKLFELQAIDTQTLLEGYAIGNVSQVVQKVIKEQSMKRGAETAQQVALADAQNQSKMNAQPQEPEEPEVGAPQANAALQAVIMGQEPEVPESITPEYLQYVDQFINSPDFKSLPPEDQQAVMAFRAKIGQLIR